jgi:hypothetical protein
MAMIRRERLVRFISWRFGLLVTIASATGCNAQSDRAVELQRRTLTNGAAAGSIRGPERTATGVRFAWDVQTSLSWVSYRTSVVAEFKRDFEIVRSDDSFLVL